MSGPDFILSYRFKQHQWLLGAKRPVSLRIKSFTNLFEMQNISADLQGTYPYSERQPLTLSNVGVDMLNGHISLSALRLPQHDAAVLKLDKVDLSALFTALKPKQFAMSGRVDGELPLFLNHPKWLVQNGWIANAGTLTLRLDKDMADAIGSNNRRPARRSTGCATWKSTVRTPGSISTTRRADAERAHRRHQPAEERQARGDPELSPSGKRVSAVAQFALRRQFTGVAGAGPHNPGNNNENHECAGAGSGAVRFAAERLRAAHRGGDAEGSDHHQYERQDRA